MKFFVWGNGFAKSGEGVKIILNGVFEIARRVQVINCDWPKKKGSQFDVIEVISFHLIIIALDHCL